MFGEVLSYGRENAKSKLYLMELLHMTEWQIRDTARTERLQGKPICHCKNGYYLAKDQEEMREFIYFYTHTATAEYIVYNALYTTLQGLPERAKETPA